MSGSPHYQEPVPSAFDEFHLIILEHGPNRKEPQTQEERDQLDAMQLAHLRLLKDLYDRGISVVSGPFVDGSGGLLILRADRVSLQEAQRLLSEDAHIKAGRLVPRFRSFYAPKGVL